MLAISGTGLRVRPSKPAFAPARGQGLQHFILKRAWFAFAALLAFALVPGAAQAQSQLLVPSVLEEMRLVTADDNAATFILRFSPAEPRYAVVERNPTRPELVMATSLKTGRVPYRFAT